MANGAQPAELLNELIEGRLMASPHAGEVAAFAALARRCRQLQLPDPTPAAQSRMRNRFWSAVEEEQSWLGLGWLRRLGLSQRLAAGVLAASVLGGTASYTAGYSPVAALHGTASFLRAAIQNLSPHMDGVSGPVGPGLSPVEPETVSESSDNENLAGDPGRVEDGLAEQATPHTPGVSVPAATPTPQPAGAAPASPTSTPTPRSTATTNPTPAGTPTPGPAPASSPDSDGAAPGSTPPTGTPRPTSSPVPSQSPLPSPSPSPPPSPSPSNGSAPPADDRPDDKDDEDDEEHKDKEDDEPEDREEPQKDHEDDDLEPEDVKR